MLRLGKRPEPEAPATVTADAPAQEQATSLDCAWCLEEQGIPAGEGSHGICTTHAALMLAQARQQRAGRQARR